MRSFLVFIVLLTACQSNDKYSNIFYLPKIYYSLNRECVKQELAGMVGDLVAAYYIPLLKKHKHISNLDDAYERLSDHAGSICLIDDPDKCSSGGVTLGPFSPSGVAARKTGCSTEAMVWVSTVWPPLCGSEWPSEPNCGTEYSKTYRWENMLAHEVFNFLVLRLVKPVGSDYSDDVYKVENENSSQLIEMIKRVM
jgi:hypothetical protein